MAPSLQHFEIIGTGACAGPNGTIVIEAGWDVETELTAAVLLRVENKLRAVRIQAEFRGYCETRWEKAGVLATKPESADYKITRTGRIFRQMVEVVYDSPEPIAQSLDSIALPFTFKLPKNNMPSSFHSDSGSIEYYIKCSMLYQESMKLLKTSVDFDIPVTVMMPEAAKLKLLKAPSQMLHQVAGTFEACGYSVQFPKRILAIGENLQVNIIISSTPPDARLRIMNASIRPLASFVSQNAYGANAKIARPLAEHSETFPLVEVGPYGSEPIVRKFSMLIDPEIAMASFESPLISVKTIFRLQITLDTSETPAVSYEVPIVVIPAPISTIPQPPALMQAAIQQQRQQEQHEKYMLSRQDFKPREGQYEAFQAYQVPIPRNNTAPHTSQYTHSLPHQSRQEFYPAPGIQQQLPNPRPTYHAFSEPPSRQISVRTARSDSYSSLRLPVNSQIPPALDRSRSMSSSVSGSTTVVPRSPRLPPFHEKAKSISSNLSGLLAELEAMELTLQPSEPREASILTESDTVSMGMSSQHTVQLPYSQQDCVSEKAGVIPEMWTTEDVVEWLRSLGCPEDIMESFQKQDVDGSVLLSLTAEDLRNDLGVAQFGVRRKILTEVSRLRAY